MARDDLNFSLDLPSATDAIGQAAELQSEGRKSLVGGIKGLLNTGQDLIEEQQTRIRRDEQDRVDESTYDIRNAFQIKLDRFNKVSDSIESRQDFTHYDTNGVPQFKNSTLLEEEHGKKIAAELLGQQRKLTAEHNTVLTDTPTEAYMQRVLKEEYDSNPFSKAKTKEQRLKDDMASLRGTSRTDPSAAAANKQIQDAFIEQEKLTTLADYDDRVDIQQQELDRVQPLLDGLRNNANANLDKIYTDYFRDAGLVDDEGKVKLDSGARKNLSSVKKLASQALQGEVRDPKTNKVIIEAGEFGDLKGITASSLMPAILRQLTFREEWFSDDLDLENYDQGKNGEFVAAALRKSLFDARLWMDEEEKLEALQRGKKRVRIAANEAALTRQLQQQNQAKRTKLKDTLVNKHSKFQ